MNNQLFAPTFCYRLIRCAIRLGSTRAWFEHDADNARQWLIDHHQLTTDGRWLPPDVDPMGGVSCRAD